MNYAVEIQESSLKKSDFVSDQEIRWCPGCGDYSILAGIQKVLPQLNTPKENFVFVSGIGCSSRLPYYMDTYGFHTLHGRAPAVASGIKLANPDLSVWIITGDGDALSIGGNHLLHILRRNLDVNILLINNRIYGLTKGQYSPTSNKGKVTKSSPKGSIASPVDPISFAISAGATFVARTIDTDAKNLQQVLLQAARHKGASFVEIYQNCHIFNDKEFSQYTDRKTKEDLVLNLNDNQPLVFGGEIKKGIVLEGIQPKVVELDDIDSNRVIKHDVKHSNDFYPFMLSQFKSPEFPLPLGIFKQQDKTTYEDELASRRTKQITTLTELDIQAIIDGKNNWRYSGE